MRITQLRIRSFRSYSDARIELAPSLTLFLGENNVGKSAAMLALTRLLTQMTPGSDQIDSGDLRYGQGRDLAIEAYIELTDGERDDILDLAFPGPSSTRAQSEPALAEWLKQRGNEIVLSLKRPLLGIPAPLLQWRDLFFLGDWVWLGEHSDYEAAVRAGRMAGRAASLPSIQPADLAEPAVIGRNFVEGLGRFLFEHLKVVREFRTASAGSRTEATESLGGADTASVLLNLKNHRDRHQRERYQQIVEAFCRLYPSFMIEAVEKEPGRAIPEIQFFERGRENPVSLAYMSSGVHQVLTLLTDLIGRDGLVIFIEHPEQHLHPHAARFVLSLMREAAERNQVIVSTHDVHFVTPDTFQGFRRFWWTAEGTQVFGPPAALLPGANQKAIEALRHLGNREMLFARAVLLVEDQTLQDFFLAVAPTLGYGLDVSGVSVIAVDGEGNFKPFRECLGALGIPFCSVRDQAWDNEERFPSARFFSFGMEIEQYLDEHGLAGEREKVAGARGMTKRKAAAALAPQLTKTQIPPLFKDILQAVVDAATGEPAGRRMAERAE